MQQRTSLNVFQKLVRCWEQIHPYNGGQVMHLRGAALPSGEQLTSAWLGTLRAMELGPVTVDGGRYFFSPPLRSYTLGMSSLPLETLLNEGLNHRFTAGDNPLRPLVTRDENGEGFYLGIVYQHWVADSVAIRLVLREWYRRLFEPGKASEKPVSLLTKGGGGYWSLFGPGDMAVGQKAPGRWSLLQGMLAAAQQSARMKRVQRIEGEGARDYTAAFSLHPMPEGTVGRLKGFAKRHGLKVNDVLLAALAEAVASHGPLTRTPRRQDLAMGTIVDMRGYPPEPIATELASVFNMYLGFTTAFVRPHHLAGFGTLAEQIAREHALARKSHAASSGMLRMAAGVAAHRILNGKSMQEFYRKRMPLSAGISNVNLRADSPATAWIPELHPGRLVRYIRVSPTGPLMPLVISATTLGDTFHFGLTRRTSLVSEEMARRIVEAISGRLASL